MEDFIRPNNNQQLNKSKRKRHIRETLFIICMLVCLTIGFASGYVAKKVDPSVSNNKNKESVINEVYETLEENWFNPNGEEIDIQGKNISAMVASLGDKHSSYFTFEEAKEFNQSVDGNYVGIGVVQRVVSEGTMVIEIFKDSPAQIAGLKVGDIITGVDGKSVAGKNASEISDLIKGQANTAVKLQILRNGKTQEVAVTRGKVDSAVYSEIRTNGNKKFGYVEINTFGSTTAIDLEKALIKFKEAKIDTLVIDLRGNGGGYLTAATSVLSLFMDSNSVLFQMEQKNGEIKKYKSSDCTKYKFLNNYILVDGQSASASEVVAGALQEKEGFKLVGSQTYGKGTAQTQKQLSDGSVLKYTYARWLLPSGKWINGVGLTPDYNVANVDISDISTIALEKNMSYDSVGQEIASMQKMLNCLGYNCGRTDGYFSKESETALKQFEQANHLTVDGIYTNNDRQRLEATVVLYANSSENDLQYKKLMELIK